MLLLRFVFRSALIWIVTRLLGSFVPIIRRLLLLIGWRV
jgi:hypothetical protein